MYFVLSERSLINPLQNQNLDFKIRNTGYYFWRKKSILVDSQSDSPILSKRSLLDMFSYLKIGKMTRSQMLPLSFKHLIHFTVTQGLEKSKSTSLRIKTHKPDKSRKNSVTYCKNLNINLKYCKNQLKTGKEPKNHSVLMRSHKLIILRIFFL